MQFEKITSRQNKTIKEVALLGVSAELRHEKNQFLIEGARLCEDAANTSRLYKDKPSNMPKIKILRAFFTETAEKKYESYVKNIALEAEKCYIVEEHVAKLLSSTRTSQGVYCQCEFEEMSIDDSMKNLGSKLLVLENLQDPSNLGAVMRTAEALNLTSILLMGDSCDVYSPKTLRASMGAAFRIQTLRVEDSSKGIEMLKESGYTTYAAVIDDTAKKLGEFAFASKSAVLVGNEGNGLVKSTIDSCDERVTIPMTGRAESLNASIAASILMWELCKLK